MTKNFTAQTLYSWKRCLPEEERSEWELLTFNPDDFFGTSLLFRRKDRSSYAVGVVGEASNSDRFFELPMFLQFYFAARQTENIWVLLAFDGNGEIMLRIRFTPGKAPLVVSTELLSSEVQRCMINRHGHILVGYDNSLYFSDTQNSEEFSPIADLSIEHTHPGAKGFVLPLLEWYDAEGNLIHMFTDNMNTSITEINIDAEDRALVTVDLADPIIRLSLDGITCIEKNCLEGTVIEGITEASDKSGYLISCTRKENDPSKFETLPTGLPPFAETFWLDADGDRYCDCRAFSESGEQLPLDSYSCRGNTILIEDEGWIYRIML